MAQPILLTRYRIPPTTSSSFKSLLVNNNNNNFLNVQPSVKRVTNIQSATIYFPSQQSRLHHQSIRRPFFPPRTTLTSSIGNKRTNNNNNHHRQYHSTLHPSLPIHEYTNSQTAILSAALEHVPSHGFTLDALTLGARDAGFLDVSVQLLPRGEFDLVLFWLASRRGMLRGKVENNNDSKSDNAVGEGQGQGQGDSVSEKVKWLVIERLMMNQKIKDQWQGVCIFLSYVYFLTMVLRIYRL